MPYVTSTAISRIEHNPTTMQMWVTFRESGKTYTFCGVPESVYRAFLSAASIGSFFNDHIKDRYAC